MRAAAARNVLVTGASRGIGRAVARAFAAHGDRVWVLAETDAIADAARELAATTGAEVRPVRCDIADPRALAAACAEVEPLDVLVANAGIERPTPLDAGSEVLDTVRRILDVNVFGSFATVHAFRERLRPGASVVFTASIWGRIGVAGFAAYCASKHAVVGLARSLSRELGPRGIRVNAVCPGWVATDAALASLAWMSRRSGLTEEELRLGIERGQALPGLMRPEDVAGLYLFLASDAARDITGQAIHVDRGEVQG